MNMRYFSTSRQQERAVLVGLALWPQKKEEIESHLDELASLAATAGANPIKKFIQQLPKPNPASFVGVGMLENIRNYAAENQIDVVIFDDELPSAQ